MNMTSINFNFSLWILKLIVSDIHCHIFLHFLYWNSICWTLYGHVVIIFLLVWCLPASLLLEALVFTSVWILVAALILLWCHLHSTETCTEVTSFIQVPDKAFRQASCHEIKLLMGQLHFHSFLTLLTVQHHFLCSESVPLEYLIAAPSLCIFRACLHVKAQNYLCWLWI